MALAMAGCSSGSKALSLTSLQVYVRATGALSLALTVEVSGRTNSAQSPATDFVVHFHGNDSSATLRMGAEVVEIRIVDGVRYVETNSAVWTDLGISSYAPQLANRWLEFPPGTPTLLGGLSTLASSWLAWGERSAATRIVFAGFEPSGRPGLASVDGIACYELTSPAGQRLLVAKSDFRPVLYIGSASQLDTIHFSYPSRFSSPKAPPSPSTLPPAPHLVG